MIASQRVLVIEKVQLSKVKSSSSLALKAFIDFLFLSVNNPTVFVSLRLKQLLAAYANNIKDKNISD